MNFSYYQQQSRQTAVYPDVGSNPYYPALGLGGEAGELLNKVKKLMRDGSSIKNEVFLKEVSKELGDILWYVAAMASEFGFDLNTIAQENLDKLFSRKERGTLKGSGDNR